MRLRGLRVLWLLLALLGAFVFFIEVIADVGGSAEPLTVPVQTPSLSQPTPTTATVP